ncbi:ABC transporter substrate-binding protein [Promicromonospora thailandica]|uniref:Peptide/nickel transport system substrate-binding protein n=1 Tax=Promicromonospora thailandica TaxID=765201 RepID=A0A9X2FZE6_9MICO|nr:ABC transporter substrate-binding protein [Promicromonospora thailandica]MCP2262868.1 peptide/nickel transport system substrate-binding protein [Promicromonospora thailandica]BFF18210.1 ABC transporter substrate-binding protein [Promicromonospora thailandica]
MPSRRFTRPRAAAVVVAAAALLLAACTSGGTSPGQESAEPVAGGTLTYASGDAEPSCLDPHVGGNYPQALIATQYLESLVSLDEDGEVVPWLATEWSESDDGMAWEFRLRDDVTFTDGTPFDAEAVAANIAHVQDPATASSTGYLALAKIQEVVAVEDHLVRLELSAPDSALLESLSQVWVAMESPKALERSQEENCAAPVGTGPFVVDRWDRQESVTLVRNDGYTSPPADVEVPEGATLPYLDGIVWRFIPDSASRYAALQSGEVQVIDNAQPDTIVSAGDDQAIVELDAPRPGASNRIELNSGKAPFDDERVREAFIRSVDVEAGIESLFFGTAERSYSPLSSVEPLGLSEPDLFTVDTDAAARLLDEAGWTERDDEGYRVKAGERLTLDFPVSTNQSIPAEQSLFEQVQADAKTAGFEVRLHPLDLSSWYGALAENDYDLVSAPYTKVGPDVLRILYHSDSITPAPSGYFANLAQVDDPELDDLLTRAAATSRDDERASLYEQAQRIILDGSYILPLYDQQNHFLHSSSVHGLRAMPTVSTPTFAGAWLAS